ncbi:hypothetical protein [Mesorhizobium australicum]|uniref:hypothetical protein n=1 Tax=Mesorhizobium australicum TaxID=536018 RepID=UPI003EBC70A9
MRDIAVDRPRHAGAFFERDHGRETIDGVEVVLDDVGVEPAIGNQRVLEDVAGVADERIEGRFVFTDTQT